MTDAEQLAVALAVAVPIFTAGAAWAAVRVGLNGVRDDTAEIKEHLKGLGDSDAKQNERLGVLETAQKAQAGWIGRLERWIEKLRDKGG